MGRGGGGGGVGADVETGRGGGGGPVDAASDDQRASLLHQTGSGGGNGNRSRGGYGTTDGPASSGHAAQPDDDDDDDYYYDDESTAAYFFRVAEPVVFWTVCTAVAAFACVNMIRMTKFNFPANRPEAYDGRSLQVGYVANSTEAMDLFVGCEQSQEKDAAYLRDDIGQARFPDFIIIGARGGPTEELGELLSSKNLACAAQTPENNFFTNASWRTSPIPLDAQKTFVEGQYSRCGGADGGDDDEGGGDGGSGGAGLGGMKDLRSLQNLQQNLAVRGGGVGADGDGDGVVFLGVPRYQTERDALYMGWAPRRMCEVMTSKETRVVTLLPNPVDHALSIFAEVLQGKELEFNFWYVRKDDVEDEKEGGEEAAAPAKSPSPSEGGGSDDAGSGGGGGSGSESGGAEKAAKEEQRARSRGELGDVANATLAATAAVANPTNVTSPAASPTPSPSSSVPPKKPWYIGYDAKGFAEIVSVDKAIAEACGPDVMLPADDDNFDESRTCCARVAAARGYASWPGCRACNPALGEASAADCLRVGELAFSPVRAGVYVNLLRRYFKYVPPSNVLVVTADQAWASGMPTLAVVVTTWRLLRLPLVDPVSVTTDLMLTLAGRGTMTAAGAGSEAGAGAGTDATSTASAEVGKSEKEASISTTTTAEAKAAEAKAKAAAREAAAAARNGGGGGGGLASMQSLVSKGGNADGAGGGGGDEEEEEEEEGVVGSAMTSVKAFFSGVLSQMGAKGFVGWGWKGVEFHEAEKQKRRRAVNKEGSSSFVVYDDGGGGGGGDDDGDVVAGTGQFQYREEARPKSEYPAGFSSRDVSEELRRELQTFYTPYVKELNALIGNGKIKWWKKDGTPLLALQKKSLNVMPSPPPQGYDGEGGFSVANSGGTMDAANFASDSPSSTASRRREV